MNIAFVNWWTFNTVMGGIEAVGARVARALTERGHHVCFATIEEGYPSIEGIPYMLFPDKRHIRSSTNRKALVTYFRRHEVEVIVCHNAYSHRLAVLMHEVAEELGVPLLFEIHNDPMGFRTKHRMPRLLRGPEYLFRRNKTLRQWRLIGQLSDQVILLSPSYIGDFCRLSGTPLEKVTFVPNPNSFLPEEVPPADGPKEPMVLYLGRLDYGQKRVDRLLQIWKEVQEMHPNWSLYIVGGGNEKEEQSIHQLTETLGLERVHFEGVQKPAKYLERAAILASTSNHEGLPLVMLEALQFGVVPIAFDSYAALRDVTDDGRVGVCVPPFDLSAYVTALSELMSDDQRRETMSEQARDWSKHYDMDRVVLIWEQLLTSLITK